MSITGQVAKPTLISLDGSYALPPNIPVLFDKFGEKTPGREVSGHVHLDQHLTGAAAASTNPNSWDRQFLGDNAGYVCRYRFKNDSKASCCLECTSVFEDLERAHGCLTLYPESSKGVLALRCQANMSDNRYSCFDNAFYCRSHLQPAFQLNALDTTLLDQPNCRLNSLFGSYFVGTHWQVTNLSEHVSAIVIRKSIQVLLTVNADFVARATLLQCRIISSNTISLVSSMPNATIARLSPTKIMSIPAASATWALGKSWAVIMVIGSCFWCSVRRVLRVTFLRCERGTPMGECELCLIWHCDSAARRSATRTEKVPDRRRGISKNLDSKSRRDMALTCFLRQRMGGSGMDEWNTRDELKMTNPWLRLRSWSVFICWLVLVSAADVWVRWGFCLWPFSFERDGAVRSLF